MEQLFDDIQGNNFFFPFESVSSWQIWMATSPRCKDMTFIVCHQGMFRFEVMSFGSMNAPATLQRMMELILSHRDYVRVSVDEVVIFSGTLEKHIVHLKNVLETINSYCLKVKFSMCSFVKPEI